MLANTTGAASVVVRTEIGMGAHPLWFPSRHPRNLCPNTANKIHLFIKKLKMRAFPNRSFLAKLCAS